MRVDDFIQATNEAGDPTAVADLFGRALADLGFDRFLYCALRNHSQCEKAALVRNYPDDWMSHYVEQGYVETDAARRQCLVARGPFLWSSLVERLPRHETRIFDEARAAGVRDGIGIGLHGPLGESMGVGVASSTGGADPGRHLQTIHLLAVQFNQAYDTLTFPAKARPDPHLTPREREVLLWAARGKSAWAIGEILNISENSVEWHLKNVFRKLDADTRITAVVKALHRGLISI